MSRFKGGFGPVHPRVRVATLTPEPGGGADAGTITRSRSEGAGRRSEDRPPGPVRKSCFPRLMPSGRRQNGAGGAAFFAGGRRGPMEMSNNE